MISAAPGKEDEVSEFLAVRRGRKLRRPSNTINSALIRAIRLAAALIASFGLRPHTSN
jgi:hypothetical protein